MLIPCTHDEMRSPNVLQNSALVVRTTDADNFDGYVDLQAWLLSIQ